MASSPPQVGKSDTQFWTYVDSAHLLWLEAIKFFGFDCPSIHDDFMLVDELQYNECKKFSEFLVEHLNDLTLVRKCSCLLDAWILANNIECRVLNLFGNTYLLINVSQLEEFINLALTMREDSELVVSFHSSVLEKLRAVKCPDIQCLTDSHLETLSVPVNPDMNQSDTEFTENIPTVNSGFPQVEMDDGTIINEIIIDGSVSEEEIKANFILSFKEWESVRWKANMLNYPKIGPTHMA